MTDASRYEAFLLRAKCHFDAQNVCAAVVDAQRACQLCPDSQEARQLLRTVNVETTSDDSGHDSAGNCTRSPATGSAQQKTALSVCTKGALATNKAASPADCSSDSGHQADVLDQDNNNHTAHHSTVAAHS